MFEAARARIQQIVTAPARALPRAAARIEEKLKSDATLHTGKVPSGISASASDEGVVVRGPKWVMELAVKKDEVSDWVEIVREEIRAAVEG